MASLKGFRKEAPQTLTPKDFLILDMRDRLQRLIYAVMFCGIVIAGMGIYLVALASDDEAESTINLLGIIEVSTGSVGIAGIALGVVVILYGIRTFMSRWQ
ncbi:hypothetical protein EU803_08250 [Loktanella sp. IMCC34160]|uniref:hypothetical protein n=1 Tax=Loktanella sp. IMCC34160 TaxID=2510646 RepID=UPI00101C5903|nr:hypothetical protein [Loktanella sp. IMCC34160]RYG91083.1 hypothetical protein EU803_08250 [Loktanella sp. IMCC34160]